MIYANYVKYMSLVNYICKLYELRIKLKSLKTA